MEKSIYLVIALSACLIGSVSYIIVTAATKDAKQPDENDDNIVDEFQYMSEPIAQNSDMTDESMQIATYAVKELRKEVLKVGEDIYVAIGYALGNSIMIEGTDGIIIVDTTESADSMRKILMEFRKITAKPVKAIIITHYHPDHILGASAIVEEERKLYPDNTVDIYSHELTRTFMFTFPETYEISLTRSLRQLGGLLQDNTKPPTLLSPTITYTNQENYSIAGIDVELTHTPGETDDHTTIWLPKQRAVLPGDNIYKAFPNLYSIRGSPGRNTRQWYESVEFAMSLNARYLVMSHTRPVQGENVVRETLLAYRDGIKFLRDQTLRLLNKGYFPSQIVERLELPYKLAESPFLLEIYGTVPWSARGVFTNYLGWFSGNPRDLNPMPESDHARRMARLVAYAKTSSVNSVDVMLQEAQNSHENSYDHYRATGQHILSDDKWALELADTVLEISDLEDWNETLREGVVKRASVIKVSALRAIGVEQLSNNGRSYYLNYAKEVETGIPFQATEEMRGFMIKSLEIDQVLRMLCGKVDGIRCQDKLYQIKYSFTDVDREMGVTLRNSVCDVFEPLPSGATPQVHLSVSTLTFKSITANDKVDNRVPDLDNEVESGHAVFIIGTAEIYEEFISCFDPMNSV